MTTPFGFPGAGAPAPAAAAPAPQQSGATFTLDIPADPTWSPFDKADVLEQDGYFCARITNESLSRNNNGVFLTLELLDDDVRGKKLSKLLPDPRQNDKTWFVWRSLMLSIAGVVEHARGAMQYTLGRFNGQLVYIKTEPFTDQSGTKTSVEAFVTKQQWEEAVARNGHRWASKRPQAVPGGGFGPAPGGVTFGLPAPAGGQPQGMPVQQVQPTASAQPAPVAPAPAQSPIAAAVAAATPFAPPAAVIPPTPAVAPAPAQFAGFQGFPTGTPGQGGN